jgi:hypothetical protein
MVSPPWEQHGEYPGAACNCIPDRRTFVCRAENDGDASLESIKLTHAAFPANTNLPIAPVQRMLRHVLPILPGCSYDKDLLHFDFDSR